MGPVRAHLHAGSSHPHTHSMSLCEGIVRLTAATASPAGIGLWPPARLLRRGHRIRFQVFHTPELPPATSDRSGS